MNRRQEKAGGGIQKQSFLCSTRDENEELDLSERREW